MIKESKREVFETLEISPEIKKLARKAIPTDTSSIKFGDFYSYKIIRKIGGGGFSDVYLIEKNRTQYAMKVPKGVNIKSDETIDITDDAKSYEKEAIVWSLLTQNLPDDVVKLIDVGKQPVPWFVMELAEESLRKGIKRMNFKEKTDLSIELLSKLDRIHHYSVTHKDLKPENILKVDGKWKFTDFGLSKIISKSTKSSIAPSGTYHYMAPEQVAKKKYGQTDWRTDIWQMGVLIYEMFTKRLPFEGEQMNEVGMAILFEEPDKPSLINSEISKGLDEVILKAIEKDKGKRWQSAGIFMNELKRALK